MTATEPSQPLTDAELAEIRDAYVKSQTVTHGLVGDPAGPYGRDCGGTTIRDVGRLLAEVYRLRAENAAVKTERDQFQKMMSSTVSAGVTIDGERLDALRERDALRAQLDAARELHEPAQSSAWNYLYCASGCGAGPLQGPDPWPCSTAEALGMALDQSGEGQANA